MQGETLLCVATTSWNSLWRPTQQLISRIAGQNRVFYFEPGRHTDRRASTELFRNLPYFFNWKPKEINDNLTLIPTPSSLPLIRQHLPGFILNLTTPLISRINSRILIRQIHRTMRFYQIHSPILWLQAPSHWELLDHIAYKLSIYFNYDEISEFRQNAKIKDLVRKYDNLLSGRVDVVLTTGRKQWERRKEFNKNTHFIPNGVNFDLFHTALEPDTFVPPDIAKLRKPIIGYAGWLGYQIDLDLVRQVADAYPDCSVALIGPDEIPRDKRYSRLASAPNVYFLGRKEPNQLPHYIKAFDVSLIPYVLNWYTLTAYPLKLHEYLAAGQPVVATSLPELKAYEHVLHITTNPDDFVKQVGLAMHEHSSQDIEKRLSVARENTWEKRVDEIYRILDPLLMEKMKKNSLRPETVETSIAGCV